MKMFGHLDLCSPTLIEGWLYSDDSHSEPIRLQVYVGDLLLGEVVADLFRQDLQDAGYGSGHCGFSFPVPPDLELSGLASTRLRLVNTPVYLLPTEATNFTTLVPDDAGSYGASDRHAEMAAPPAARPPPGEMPSQRIPRKGYLAR